MHLTFWGAAKTVTGSMHQLTVQNKSYLLDCGLYQGRRKEAEERNRKFPFPCNQISAVMLSHAHIDHSGNLPLLVKNGFNGPIYASPGTVDLCRPMLTDSASLQEKDAEFLNKRYLRRKSIGMNSGQPVEPLYTTKDAEATFALFRPTPMHTSTPIGPGVQYTSFEAGHIFGSTSMVLDLESDGHKVRLGFSGDLRSEEHTSELQSHLNLVCRLLLEKKKNHPQSHVRTRIGSRARPRAPASPLPPPRALPPTGESAPPTVARCLHSPRRRRTHSSPSR